MSEENVEIVEQGWKAWMEGDPAGQSMLDPEVTYETDILPDQIGETFHGVQGMLDAWAIWAEPWQSLETALEWVRDAGDDAVVSCHRVQAYGKGSGVEIDTRYYYFWRFRRGKIVHVKTYGDVAEALEAAGLSE